MEPGERSTKGGIFIVLIGGKFGVLLTRGPDAAGYERGLWTAWRVADWIERELGIEFHPGHVWRILRQLGWTAAETHGAGLRAGRGGDPALEEVPLAGSKKKPKGKARRFVAQQNERLTLETLSAYAPELNPVEFLWGHWKQHELPNLCPKNFSELSFHACQGLRRNRRRKTLVNGF